MPDQTTLHKCADELLKEISELKADLVRNEALYNEEISAIEKHYEGIGLLKTEIADREKALIALMRKNKGIVFDGDDKISLDHGILLYGSEDKVSIPKNALGKIKAQGWNEAIKVVESVKRDIVSKWPEERLFVIGAKRKTKENFSYELED